jgi:hypothetical protein
MKMSRVRNCTTVPKKKATATERKMPMMTERAFSVLRSVAKPKASPPAAILMSDTAKAAPKSSKTMETVVEVGMPKVLKMSRRMTSVTMTAMKMQMTS